MHLEQGRSQTPVETNNTSVPVKGLECSGHGAAMSVLVVYCRSQPHERHNLNAHCSHSCAPHTELKSEVSECRQVLQLPVFGSKCRNASTGLGYWPTGRGLICLPQMPIQHRPNGSIGTQRRVATSSNSAIVARCLTREDADKSDQYLGCRHPTPSCLLCGAHRLLLLAPLLGTEPDKAARSSG